MNSSAQITSAECCAPVTQGSGTTGRDTGGARNLTAWVGWRHTLMSQLLGSWFCPSLDTLHPWGRLPGAALTFVSSLMSRYSDNIMPAVTTLIKPTSAKEFFRELVPVRS